MSAQKQQPAEIGKQLLEGFRSVHSRLVDSQQQQSQSGFEQPHRDSVPSVTSELVMLLTPTNRVSSGPFRTPEKDESFVRLHSDRAGSGEVIPAAEYLGGRNTFPENGRPQPFETSNCTNNIRQARVMIQSEPSIEQAININHLLEVNQLLRSENNSLQQNNHLLRMLLAEKERQLEESGQLELKQELDELKDLVQRLQLEKMQQLMQSHTSQSNSDANVSISLMDKHMQELKEDLKGHSERLRDKERQTIVLRECLREEKNANDRLLHQVRELEEQLRVRREHLRRSNAGILNTQPSHPQEQQQTVVKQPHQPLLLMRGRRSYSVSSHQQSQEHLPLQKQKSRVQLQMKDSERVLGYYTNEIGRLIAQNDRLQLESNRIMGAVNELRINEARLEQQRNSLRRQLQNALREVQSKKGENERNRKAANEEFDRLRAEITRLESDVREKSTQLEKREHSLSYYIKLAEEGHLMRARVNELQCELQRIQFEKEQSSRGKDLAISSRSEIEHMWQQKNSGYASLQKQLGNFKELSKIVRK